MTNYAKMRATSTLRIIALCWLCIIAPFAAASPPVANPQDATVFIKVFVEGEDPTSGDTVRRVLSTGSGVLVSAQGTVITAKHVVDHRIGPSDRIIVVGSIRSSRDPNPWPLDYVGESTEADIAVLSFPRDLLGEFPHLCVLLGGYQSDVAFGLGFPGGGNFSARPGTVTAAADETGRVQVNMGLARGMSGGPIVNKRNEVVGIIAGGIEGTNSFDYFTPIERATSLLLNAPVAMVGDTCDDPAMEAEQIVTRTVRVDETNDSHDSLTSETTKSYTVVEQAKPGYSIVNADFTTESEARMSELVVAVSTDRKSVTMTFRLTAGPQVDRYRGWLHGDLKVTMEADSGQ